MDTQNLRAFVAVAASGSFSLAADKLNVTQPAISKRIHLLEDQLDAKLFDRLGRQVSLTEAGITLLPHAGNILNAIDAARQAIIDLSGEVKGRLKLVTSHHIGLHRLPGILRRYNELYPEVELDIQFLDSQTAYRDVLKGDYDLGVITRVSDCDRAISSETLWNDRLAFVAARQHPLARESNLTLARISAFPALLPEQKFSTTKLVEDLFHANGLGIKLNLTTNYLETIKALISVGYAWGILPETMLEDESLAVLNPEGVKLVRKLDVIYHRERTMSNAGKAFLAMLLKVSEPEPFS